MNKSLLLVLALLSFGAFAQDLGMRGVNQYPIDRDARESMKDLMRSKVQSGEFDAYKQKFINQNINAIKNPAPLGIASNYRFQTQMFSPAFVVPGDYKDQNNRVVVSKGTVIKPLEIAPLKTGLIFIDGRDQQQVDYAIRMGRKIPLKIVLVAGSPYDLRVKYKNADWNGRPTIPFYFDQKINGKNIISQLNALYRIDINRVPAMLYQQNNLLRVDFGIPS